MIHSRKTKFTFLCEMNYSTIRILIEVPRVFKASAKILFNCISKHLKTVLMERPFFNGTEFKPGFEIYIPATIEFPLRNKANSFQPNIVS